MNTYAVDIHFRGIIKAKNMTDFKKSILNSLGSHKICRRKVDGHGVKMNLSTSSIRRILKKEGCI